MMSFALFPVGELLESRAQDQSRPETVSRKAAPKKCDSGRLSGQAFRRAAIGLTVRQDALGPLADAPRPHSAIGARSLGSHNRPRGESTVDPR